jgi:hypothetical protein
MHDTTLLAIGAARPASLVALRRIDGIGPAKLDLYGDEILAVLAGLGDQVVAASATSTGAGAGSGSGARAGDGDVGTAAAGTVGAGTGATIEG